MKISDVVCHKVHARRQPAFGKTVVTGLGPAPGSRYTVVEIRSNEGITGWGEIASVFDPDGHALASVVEERLQPFLVGSDPRDVAALNRRMDSVLERQERPAKAGVDIALHDLVAKTLDIPVYRLLGGLSRRRIPLSYSVPFGEPDEMAAFAAEKVQLGFGTVKVKIGQGHDRDVMAVRRIREAIGPTIILRIDANMSFTDVKQARETIAALASYAPELVEQPFPPDRLSDLSALRKQVQPPIMVDENLWGPDDLIEVIRHDAADVANVYVMESGGLTDAAKNFSIAAAAGMKTMIGSMPELAIGTAAQIHLGAAMPNLDLASDCCGSLYHIDDVVDSPLLIEDGHAVVSDQPGLGIEPDRERLAILGEPEE